MTAAQKLQPSLPFEIVCDSRQRESWLAARRATIGASESAIVLGASPWGSLLELWATKTGRADGPSLDEQEFVFWGLELEDSIIRGYAKRAQRWTVPFGLNLRSTRWPWLSATPDALVTDDPACAERLQELSATLDRIRLRLDLDTDANVLAGYTEALTVLARGWWPLQTKNIGFSSAEHWVEGVPLYYRIQCTQESLVFGSARTTGAALIAGQKLAWDDIEVDERGLLERQIVNLTQAFVRDYIDTQVEPPVDGSESARQTIAALYPLHVPGREIAIGGDWQERVDLYDRDKAEVKATEKTLAAFENAIRQEMQDAERCTFPDGSGFTLKTASNGSRRLLRKKAKEQ